MHTIYPQGRIELAGWDLVHAVSAATETLGWFEALEDEVPPENYWHSPEHIKDWWASVRQRRQDKSKGMESIEPSDGDGDEYVDPDIANLR